MNARLRASIERERNRVLDLELVVDARREAVDRAVVDLRAAVRERDRSAVHLASLIEWHDELEGIAATFGPEIAERAAARREASV